MKPLKRSQKEKKNLRGCGPIAWCLISGIIVLAGLYFTFQQLKLLTWEKAPCEITQFQIQVHPNQNEPFEPQVRFRFRHEGQEFIGTQINSSERKYSSYQKLEKLRRKLEQDGNCYYDPNNPEEAILTHSSGGIWGSLILTIFGSLFLFMGIAMLRSKNNHKKAISSKSKSKDKQKQQGLFVFAIFTIVGMGLLAGLVFPTAKKYSAVRSWEPVEATVIWSKLRSQSSDDGTTYRPDIFYRYHYQGEDYRSNSYSLLSGSSSGRSGKQAIVNAHPRKHKFTCYVNPKKPWQALVNRDLGWWALFGLFPLTFLAIGLGGIVQLLKNPGKRFPAHSPANSGDTTTTHLSSRGQANGQTTPRKPKGKNRWGQFIGHLFFAVFWCGIVSIFFINVLKGWTSGNPDWFTTIFLTPFVLIGVFAVVTIPHSFLAIFSPRFDFDIKEKELKPGLATKFRWQQTGGSGQLTQMTITLLGREEATYKQGTNRSTATSLFYKKEIFQSTHPTEMLNNECDLIFPADALPTLVGEHNQIIWQLELHGAVKNRPDVREQMELTLQPLTPDDFR